MRESGLPSPVFPIYKPNHSQHPRVPHISVSAALWGRHVGGGDGWGRFHPVQAGLELAI